VKLGCIADDFTGATDLANNLAAAGMRVVMTNGVPDAGVAVNADAFVIALKSRTVTPHEAVRQSIAACRALKLRGAEQIYFKICSTFDSTAQGNIGPVVEALMRELGCAFSVVAPAFPGNGRTVKHGVLYVNGVPLSETSMRNHPLTPMRDSDLQRLLKGQLSDTSAVGLVDATTIDEGDAAVRSRMNDLQAAGVAIAIADSTDDRDLTVLARALQDASFFTASSGLGVTLPSCRGFRPAAGNTRLPAPSGRAVILAGSCSAATQQQVAAYLDAGGAAFLLKLSDLLRDHGTAVKDAVRFAIAHYAESPERAVMIYSTCDAHLSVAAGVTREAAGQLVEEAFASIVQELKSQDVRQWVVAGGETSGIVVQSLGVKQLQIGKQIDLGVPWCWAEADGVGIHLALKSGNFGSKDFFLKSLQILEEVSL
jgi:uncharacterized protein YgbK (DUF1537 family)